MVAQRPNTRSNKIYGAEKPFACSALQFAVAFPRRDFSRSLENLEQKNILQTISHLTHFSIVTLVSCCHGGC